MAAVLPRVAGLDALDRDAEAKPADRELEEIEQGIGAGEGHAIVAADGPLILFLVSSKFAPGMRIFRAKWGTLAREPKYETGERPRARPAVANFLQTPSSHFGSLV